MQCHTWPNCNKNTSIILALKWWRIFLLQQLRTNKLKWVNRENIYFHREIEYLCARVKCKNTKLTLCNLLHLFCGALPSRNSKQSKWMSYYCIFWTQLDYQKRNSYIALHKRYDDNDYQCSSTCTHDVSSIIWRWMCNSSHIIEEEPYTKKSRRNQKIKKWL